MRIIASWSEDEVMCKAFRDGLDLHTFTAAKIFGVPYDSPEVGKKSVYRSRAKNLNFGIIYGIGAARFAKNAGLTEEEGVKMIQEYFELYKGLHAWLENAKFQATHHKKSRTMSGRLFVHKFEDHEKNRIALAERNGCNFPIQGTNADILKIALHYLYQECGGYAKIINIIHDQILMETPAELAEKTKEALCRNMIKAGEVYIKNVPVLVDAQILDKWKK
jgi:DNA polymerase-1